MDDFVGDLDYFNGVRDAQMFQRAPLEYYDDAL